MLGRRYSRRRPTLRDGITPRLAQSSTVDLGTRRSSATSRAVSTSAAVSGRSNGRRTAAAGCAGGGGGDGSLIWPVSSCLGIEQN